MNKLADAIYLLMCILTMLVFWYIVWWIMPYSVSDGGYTPSGARTTHCVISSILMICFMIRVDSEGERDPTIESTRDQYVGIVLSWLAFLFTPLTHLGIIYLIHVHSVDFYWLYIPYLSACAITGIASVNSTNSDDNVYSAFGIAYCIIQLRRSILLRKNTRYEFVSLVNNFKSQVKEKVYASTYSPNSQ
jgi:hypothetical protein